MGKVATRQAVPGSELEPNSGFRDWALRGAFALTFKAIRQPGFLLRLNLACYVRLGRGFPVKRARFLGLASVSRTIPYFNDNACANSSTI
jgi:hypothetical protein